VSLQFNVATLLREPVGSTRHYDIDDNARVDERRHVTGRASFLRTNRGILVTARLAGVLAQECSRCLKPLEVPIAIEFEEEYFASVQPGTGAPLPPPDDPEAFRIDARHILDLEDAVSQFWTAALPMQPLCQPDCRGLCPSCGQDWNTGQCDCAPGGDPRWSALEQLSTKLEKT
jgi:uncharacterized protein